MIIEEKTKNKNQNLAIMDVQNLWAIRCGLARFFQDLTRWPLQDTGKRDIMKTHYGLNRLK
jgi:hypothetical protein